MTRTTIDPTTSLDHETAVELGRTAYRRFVDALATVPRDGWSAPTDCEGWNVRDLAGHVLGAMRAAASSREFVSQFLEIKRRVRRDGGNETDTMTLVQLERCAGLGTEELIAESRRLVDPAANGRRRLPAVVRNHVKIAVEIGPISERWSVGYLLGPILTRDAWLHRIDLCRALGVDPVLTPDHDGVIAADVAAEWARRHGQPCRLLLTGPAGGELCVGTDGEPITIDAVEFCRILSGRAPGSGLLATFVPF